MVPPEIVTSAFPADPFAAVPNGPPVPIAAPFPFDVAVIVPPVISTDADWLLL